MISPQLREECESAQVNGGIQEGQEQEETVVCQIISEPTSNTQHFWLLWHSFCNSMLLRVVIAYLQDLHGGIFAFGRAYHVTLCLWCTL